jgi:excisionase family DNA binding protein
MPPIRATDATETKPTVEPLLLTMRETGALGLGSRATLYRMIDRGELEAIRIGTSRRITTRSIHKFLAARGIS